MAWHVQNKDGQMQYDLHEGQSAIFRSGARFKAAIAGTGGGKTAIGPLWCLQECQRVLKERGDKMDEEPIVGMILAPTVSIMSRATSAEFVRVFKHTEFAGRYVESRNVYILPHNWGKVWLLSADRPEGVEGGQVDFVWMDEAGQMKYATWEAVLGRTGVRNSPVLITTTPYGINWLKKKFCDRADEGDKEYFYAQWSSIDNPAYSRASYDTAQRAMSPARFRMRYHGEFTVSVGLVYPWLQDRVKFFSDRDVPPGTLVGGQDWGWSPDPRVTIAALRTRPPAEEPVGGGIIKPPTDHLWIFFERYVREETSYDHARRIPHGCKYYVDSSGGEEIGIMKKAHHLVIKNRVMRREIGIDAVVRRLRLGTVTIHPCCENLIAESLQYQYPVVDDEIVGGEPKGPHHALDAVRYMIANVDRYLNMRGRAA